MNFDWWQTISGSEWLLILAALIMATVIAALVTPLIIKLYRAQGWVEQPSKKNQVQRAKNTHLNIVPRGGGLAIFLAVLAVSLFFLKMDLTMVAILAGGAMLAAVGCLDDVYDIHPAIRLIVNFVVAGLVIGAGVTIDFVTNPLGEGVINLNYMGVISILVTAFFIVWNMNIVNWSKGIDGQMPGFVGIAAIFIGLLSLRFWGSDQSALVFNNTLLSFIVAGAFFGFLIWNFYPQKIMPGYGGGTLGGYFLSVLAILSGAKVATMLMVLAIPTADAIFTIVRRIRAGKSPFWGDRGHLHHKLLDELGWGRRRIAVFYWVVALLMGILSLILTTQGKIAAIVIAAIVTFVFLIWAKIHSLSRDFKKKKQEEK